MAKGDRKFYENAGLMDMQGKVAKFAQDTAAPAMAKANATIESARKMTSQMPLGTKDYDMAGIKMPAMPKTPSMPAMPQAGGGIANKALGKAKAAVEKASNFGQQVSQMAQARRTARTPRTPRQPRTPRMGMRRNRA